MTIQSIQTVYGACISWEKFAELGYAGEKYMGMRYKELACVRNPEDHAEICDTIVDDVSEFFIERMPSSKTQNKIQHRNVNIPQLKNPLQVFYMPHDMIDYPPEDQDNILPPFDPSENADQYVFVGILLSSGMKAHFNRGNNIEEKWAELIPQDIIKHCGPRVFTTIADDCDCCS